MHRGCFFGCMTQSNNDVLDKATELMNIPDRIVHMAEKVFELLPKDQSILRPVQLFEAIPTNKNTKKARKKVMYRILMDEKY